MTSERVPAWVPTWGVPPGEVLVEALEERGMSQTELARRMARPAKTISEIANGKAAITPETAIQLERALGINASVWNALETRYRESLARKEAAVELRSQVGWLSNFPTTDMTKLGLLPQGRRRGPEMVTDVLEFFQVASEAGWERHWGQTAVALRSSTSHETSRFALAAWLRWGELAIEDLDLGPYETSNFRNAIMEARRFSRVGPFAVAIRRLQSIFGSAGVAFVVRPELTGTRVSGAARWSHGNPLIQLSLRYRSDDQFWFSLFHEAWHVLRGRNLTDVVEEVDPDSATDAHEVAANKFARDILIPPGDFRRFLDAGDLSSKAVRRFARDQGISPGIVVGRLQHERVIEPSQLNYLKRRYTVSRFEGPGDGPART